MVKLAGKKRWPNLSSGRTETDIMTLERLADSNHNTIRYYLDKGLPLPKEKLEKIEIQLSQILGLTRSILGRRKWFNQLTLKRFRNPAPNHDPKYNPLVSVGKNNNNNSSLGVYNI